MSATSPLPGFDTATQTAAEDDITDAWDDAPEALHEIRWELEPDCVRGTIICRGDETSDCHQYCDHGCELSPCEHPPKPSKACGRVPYFDDGVAEFYNGPSTSVRDGLITLVWDGDCYLWHYADEPPATRSEAL